MLVGCALEAEWLALTFFFFARGSYQMLAYPVQRMSFSHPVQRMGLEPLEAEGG